MTKKDFELIAAALHATKPRPIWELDADMSLADQLHTWHHVCDRIAATLAEANPKFRRERFLKACGKEDRT